VRGGRRRTALGHFGFFASAEQVPAPQLAWPAPAFDGFLPVFFFGFASAVGAAAVVSAGAAAGVAVAEVPEAAVVAGAVAVESVVAAGAAAVAGAAAAPVAVPLPAPQLAAEHDAWPAAAVGGDAVCVAVAGVCGAGSAPPHPMRAPAPSAASVLAKAWTERFGRMRETPFELL
jgi:hypothetical protein